MGGIKKGTWVGGAVFLALVMCAGAWFLLVSPMFAAASEARASAESTRQQNQVLELGLVQLEADFAKLPEYQAELATLHEQLPTDAELSTYLRELDEVARARSVVITSISPTTPAAFVPVVPVAAPVAVEPAAEPAAAGTDAASTDAAAVAPVATGPVVPAGFATIPFSITVIGSYPNTLAFLDDLQRTTKRLLLVSALTGTSQAEAEASGGRPATAVGDQELLITGFAYVLPDPTTVAVPADITTLPGAVDGKNPLVPVGGK